MPNLQALDRRVDFVGAVAGRGVTWRDALHVQNGLREEAQQGGVARLESRRATREQLSGAQSRAGSRPAKSRDVTPERAREPHSSPNSRPDSREPR